MDCIFCKIANKEIDTKFSYEDDKIIAFDDINPQAPYHKLVIPKQHIATLNDLSEKNVGLISKMAGVAINLAKELDIADTGYRLVLNCNSHGGQEVFHIHLHLLGGRPMHWPPG